MTPNDVYRKLTPSQTRLLPQYIMERTIDDVSIRARTDRHAILDALATAFGKNTAGILNTYLEALGNVARREEPDPRNKIVVPSSDFEGVKPVDVMHELEPLE